MRDPSIVQDDKGTFHLVWTTGWWDQGIGYASSKDLIHWSEQKNIPVMQTFEGTRNTWAPELFYDRKDQTFYIFWASTVPGMFAEVSVSESEKGHNHRLFYVTTKDFVTFSETNVFFDPCFSVIDGSIFEKGGTYYLFVNNENSNPPEKNIRVLSNTKPFDFPIEVSAPITVDYWAEGPSPLQIGEYIYVYFDRYTEGRYGAIRSKDLKIWEEVSDSVSFPQGFRHGTAFLRTLP
jgi:beta-galactosidase